MKRRVRLVGLLLTAVILLAVPAANAAAQTGRVAELTQQLDREVPGLLRTYRVSGTALAVIEHGTVAHAQGFGVADVAAGTPMTGDTVFQAASISKAVTAWGVMRLVEQGKLQLDAPAEQYLTRWHIPPFAFDGQGVTIRRLLSHTAGLSTGASTGYNGFEPGEPLPTLEESLAGKTRPAGGVQIVSAPGTSFSYSGANYLMLQLVIEEVSGQSFSTYMQQEVLAPLGMTRSSYTWSPALQPATAQPYDAWGRQLPSHTFTEQAVGGLYTTAADLGRWVAAHLPGPGGEAAGRGVLLPETIREMLTPQPATAGAYLGDASSAWGLGYTLNTEAGRSTIAQHTGDNIGYKTWAVFQPEAGIGFVVLTNSDRGTNLNAALTRRWLD
ncbi:MAG TPA: serine hydrolase domain-containing protein [Herpetosiphonaceae bacterium]|nr:serine hydrolase domain-containing protein [Herpetosiphonaceae bacterium]